MGPTSYSSWKGIIPLDILVLDDATGKPIPGARVDLQIMRVTIPDSDKTRDLHPGITLGNVLTGENGRMLSPMATMPIKERRLDYAFFGLVPLAGDMEVYMNRNDGVRVEAGGYETWMASLDDIAEDTGQPVLNMTSFPITVRLKRSPIERTSPLKAGTLIRPGG